MEFIVHTFDELDNIFLEFTFFNLCFAKTNQHQDSNEIRVKHNLIIVCIEFDELLYASIWNAYFTAFNQIETIFFFLK